MAYVSILLRRCVVFFPSNILRITCFKMSFGFHSIYQPSSEIYSRSRPQKLPSLGEPSALTGSDPRLEGALVDKEDLVEKGLAGSRRVGKLISGGGQGNEGGGGISVPGGGIGVK